MAGRRTLRSGKEFSAFDLALERAITTPALDFDTGLRIQETLLEQMNCTEDLDDLDDLADYTADLTLEPAHPADPSPSPSSLAPPSPLPSSSKRLSAAQNDKDHSKKRRAKKREKARLASSNPVVKAPAWIGLRDAPTPPDPVELETAIGGRVYTQRELDLLNEEVLHGSAMGGRAYTQAEIDALVGTTGFMYIAWLGILTIPILDARRRVIAVLGGRPRDPDWQNVADGAHALMQERLPRLRLSAKRLRHRRAQRAFAAVSRGPSYGSGQDEPTELHNNVTNTLVTDELLQHPYFQRISGFANGLFAMWAPKLYAFYQAQMKKLRGWKNLRWNFPGCAFAGATLNFGPITITAPHIDFANLAWGWCSITALGDFDPDVGGLLILWHLKLVIRFPPGSTVLIPSALCKHSNTPIRRNETRSSFAQYTAGGLFHWVWNGFKTDAMFRETATDEEKAQRVLDDASRWKMGVDMFSSIDNL